MYPTFSDCQCEVRILLFITTAAPVIAAPENYTLVEGSDVIITFDILGHPSPHKLTYFLNGVQLSAEQSSMTTESFRVVILADQKGSLLIRDVRRSDAGVYSLFAKNAFGESSGHTRLIVQCK